MSLLLLYGAGGLEEGMLTRDLVELSDILSKYGIRENRDNSYLNGITVRKPDAHSVA